MRELRRYIGGLASERIAQPTDDLLSAMIEAEADGQKLDLEQVVVTTMTFLTAGFESTNNCFTNLAYALAQHPELLDANIMLTHYSEERLFSDRARAGFVVPDRQPIPGVPAAP